MRRRNFLGIHFQNILFFAVRNFSVENQDEKFICRCIELSQESVDSGDAAFGAVIVQDGKIIVEALNDYKTKVTEHAEIVALNKAHKLLGTSKLSDCTLYSNCEPCAMCSFMIREFKVKRVVYALPSLYMGGHSRWNILQDEELEKLNPYFGKPPEVLGGILQEEAQKVMLKTPLWMFGSDAEEREK